MKNISRREALSIGFAAAIIGVMSQSDVAAPVSEAAKPDIVAWAVGTPGEFDWKMIRARSYEDAIWNFACETVGGDGCEEEDASPDCDCEWCYTIHGVEADRQQQWDTKHDVTNADWIRIGMGSTCAYCRDEVYADDGGYAVGDKAIHEDCMTIADWKIIDPDRASRLSALPSHPIASKDG